MSWQREFNSLFTDSFFRFLFGFTVIIATSFGIVIAVSSLSESSNPHRNAPFTADAHTS